jgi:arginine exporter protein ArgO
MATMAIIDNPARLGGIIYVFGGAFMSVKKKWKNENSQAKIIVN